MKNLKQKFQPCKIKRKKKKILSNRSIIEKMKNNYDLDTTKMQKDNRFTNLKLMSKLKSVHGTNLEVSLRNNKDNINSIESK